MISCLKPETKLRTSYFRHHSLCVISFLSPPVDLSLSLFPSLSMSFYCMSQMSFSCCISLCSHTETAEQSLWLLVDALRWKRYSGAIPAHLNELRPLSIVGPFVGQYLLSLSSQCMLSSTPRDGTLMNSIGDKRCTELCCFFRMRGSSYREKRVFK